MKFLKKSKARTYISLVVVGGCPQPDSTVGLAEGETVSSRKNATPV